MSAAPSSPCVKLCTLEDGLCVGCGRTLAEIARWGAMSERERLSIMAKLADRLRDRDRATTVCAGGP